MYSGNSGRRICRLTDLHRTSSVAGVAPVLGDEKLRFGVRAIPAFFGTRGAHPSEGVISPSHLCGSRRPLNLGFANRQEKRAIHFQPSLCRFGVNSCPTCCPSHGVAYAQLRQKTFRELGSALARTAFCRFWGHLRCLGDELHKILPSIRRRIRVARRRFCRRSSR